MAEARGIEALRKGQLAVAAERLEQAAAEWANLNRLFDQARVLNALGRALLQSGDGRKARSAFEQAATLMDTLAGELEDVALRSSFLSSVGSIAVSQAGQR